MGTPKPQTSSLLLFILFFSSTTLYSTASGPAFACDAENNVSLLNFPFCNSSLPINRRVQDLIGKLSLEEKIKFLAMGTFPSIDRLGIPKYQWVNEALHGIIIRGRAKPISGATSFPQVILTAASFNLSLFEAIGKAISTEARALYNVGQTTLSFFTPNANIFVDPRWGRGQETPGEDPLLASQYVSAYVKGLQGSDGDSEKLKVAGTCKHYTAYDFESWHGFDRYHFDAIVTKQDLEDTYNPPFKSCVVEGKVASIMCAYNKVNGKSVCGDRDLLYGVIRGQWKLDGVIVSNCDGVDVMYKSQHYTKTKEETAALTILAGLDLDCGPFTGIHTVKAVQKGLVNESDIDKRVFNNFRTLMRLGFFDGNPKKHMYGNLGPKDVCSQEHQELALDAARQGIVLLKNSPASLPFSPDSIQHLAVIGPNANVTTDMLGSYAGSPCKNTTFLQGLTKFVRTSYSSSCLDVVCHAVELDEAKKMASVADATVLVMGLNKSIEREMVDRMKIRLPGKQQRVITEVAKVSKGPVILVIMSGGGVDISFAKSNNNITSILWVGYPGEAGGDALADVIFGHYNPGGRLSITWYPESYVEKVPMNDMNVRPDVLKGYPGRTYRFYTGDTVYSFGDGISYSKIHCKIVQAPESVIVEETRVCDENSSFDMQLKIENLGKMRVGYSVLLFSTPPFIHNSPKRQLVDFQKVTLNERQAVIVTFKLNVCKHLSIVDEAGIRRIAMGEHIFHVENVSHSLTVKI